MMLAQAGVSLGSSAGRWTPPRTAGLAGRARESWAAVRRRSGARQAGHRLRRRHVRVRERARGLGAVPRGTGAGVPAARLARVRAGPAAREDAFDEIGLAVPPFAGRLQGGAGTPARARAPRPAHSRPTARDEADLIELFSSSRSCANSSESGGGASGTRSARSPVHGHVLELVRDDVEAAATGERHFVVIRAHDRGRDPRGRRVRGGVRRPASIPRLTRPGPASLPAGAAHGPDARHRASGSGCARTFPSAPPGTSRAGHPPRPGGHDLGREQAAFTAPLTPIARVPTGTPAHLTSTAASPSP